MVWHDRAAASAYRRRPGDGRRTLRHGRLRLLAALLLLTACGVTNTTVGSAPTATPPATATAAPTSDPATVTVAAAGDIACSTQDRDYNGGEGTDRACRMGETADLIAASGVAAVLALGDNQYHVDDVDHEGVLRDYQGVYDRTWGRFKAITYPVPGNHEYLTPGAKGYFDYFGARAGDRSRGYYSFDLGSWHIIALNSNCAEVGGCDAGSPQERWLREDLAAHPARCTLAYWHHPRFSSGTHGSDLAYDAFWRALGEAKVEVVVNAHEHLYERFSRQTADRVPNQDGGIRQFIVGTGGHSLYGFGFIARNSAARSANTFGILLLMLGPTGYSWRFVSESGKTFTDSGTSECR